MIRFFNTTKKMFNLETLGSKLLGKTIIGLPSNKIKKYF